ncbi:MAG: hypothetical protein B6I19_00285 [Bacteroidetes bacterium 4572_114]|nr:MAG: hypothetical protein B6I19_00285 [Bacteroidetes bacterium 4572_114]
MNNILVDTGFWFGLYDKRDSYHNQAIGLYEYLSLGNIIIPYPSLYETINTRFAKNKEGIEAFEIILNKSEVTLLDDSNKAKATAHLSTFGFSRNASHRLEKPKELKLGLMHKTIKN